MMRFFTLFIVVLSIENKDGHCVYEKTRFLIKTTFFENIVICCSEKNERWKNGLDRSKKMKKN